MCVCVWSQKHRFLRCFVASDDPNFFVGENKKPLFLPGFWFRGGVREEKLASWKSFDRDGVTYRQHSLNIALMSSGAASLRETVSGFLKRKPTSVQDMSIQSLNFS